MKYLFKHGWGVAFTALTLANLAFPFCADGLSGLVAGAIGVLLGSLLIGTWMGARMQRYRLTRRLAWQAGRQLLHNLKDFGQPTDEQFDNLMRRVEEDPDPPGTATFRLKSADPDGIQYKRDE